MILVGPSLGAAVAVDFAVNYPEAVSGFFKNMVNSAPWIHFSYLFTHGLLTKFPFTG